MPDVAAAWYPDPVGRHEQRWWDGSRWTGQVIDGDRRSVDVAQVPAGWLQDETGRVRWWDGQAWGQYQHPAPPPPPPQAEPAPSSRPAVPIQPLAGLSSKQLRALAKSERNWYQKKRFWAVGAFGLLMIALMNMGGAGGGADTPGGGPSSRPPGTDHPPQDDVVVTACEKGSVWPEAKLTITNNSSKRSNYTVEMTLTNADGAQISTGTAFVENVEAGQTALDTVTFFGAGSQPFADCEVVDVDRMASY